MPAIGLDIGGSSVKGTLLIRSQPAATARSKTYTQPDRTQIDLSIQAVLDKLLASRDQLAPDHARPAMPVGVCLPGAVEPATGRLRCAVNLPALVGVEVIPWLAGRLSAMGFAHDPAALVVTTDAAAAAVDLAFEPGAPYPFAGRLAAICLGTGVGLGVVDTGEPLRVEGASAGHLGQVDVAVALEDGSVPIGPDGGRGSLEAYCAAPALRDRLGPRWHNLIASLPSTDPCLEALARAIRIVHAIYRPSVVAIAGGVGLQLRPHAQRLTAMINEHLTSAADRAWSWRWATDTMHASAGAARLAQGRSG